MDINDNIRSCDASKIKGLAHLPKDIFIIGKNCNKLPNTSNINSNIDDICSLYDKSACDIEQCNIDRNDINITLCDTNVNAVDKIKTVKIISNVEFNNTYKIIDKGNILNETCVMDNILNTTLVDFAPLAESTLKKEKSTPECIMTNANIESLTSEDNMDDSFHIRLFCIRRFRFR